MIAQAAFKNVLIEAAQRLGCQPVDLQVAKAASDSLQARQFGRIFALLGDTCLTKAGSEGQFAQQLYHRLWRSPEWNPSFDQLVVPVQEAFSKVAMTKQAIGLKEVGSMARTGGNTSGSMLSLLSALVLGGATVGSGLGALNWHMNRLSTTDDAKNEELDTKSQFYRNMADQIRQDSRLKNWQQGVSA